MVPSAPRRSSDEILPRSGAGQRRLLLRSSSSEVTFARSRRHRRQCRARSTATPPQTPSIPAPAARQQFERVPVTAGRSTIVPTDFAITRIAITNPEVADAVVVQPREILIDGKKAGTVSLIVWGADRRAQYDIVVEPAITTLEQHLQTLFPGEAIAVSVSEEAVILSGQVSSTAVMLRAGEIARASSAEDSGHQHAAGAGRQREPAGDAAGALRRGESPRVDRARSVPFRAAQSIRRPVDDAAVQRTRIR